MITSNDKPSPPNYDGSYINSRQDENSLVDNKISSLLKKLTPTKSPQKRFVRPSALTENKNDAVKQHHLFIDPFSLEGKSVRKKTFKNQFSGNYGVHTQIKQHPYIEEIISERKGNFRDLLVLSSNLSDESCAKTFYELMLFNLNKGHALDILFPRDCSIEPPDELKKIYNQILIMNLDDLKNIMDLDSLTPLVLILDAFKVLETQYTKVKSQINDELVKGYCEIEKNLQKLDLKVIDNEFFVGLVADVLLLCNSVTEKKSQDFYFLKFMESFSTTVYVVLGKPLKIDIDMKIVSEFIQRFWIREFAVTNMTAKVTANRNTDIKQSLKKCFDRIKNDKDKTKIFDLILPVNLNNPELNITESKLCVDNPDLKELLKCILEILYTKYSPLKGNHKEKLELLKADLKTYVLDSANLTFFMDQKKSMLPKDPSLLEVLTKEYKQHSLARFDHLFNHFTAFANVVDDLGNLGNTRYPNFKVNFRQIVSHLIENSTIENTGQSKDKTLEEKKTIISDLHRETMGKEEIPKTDVESSLIRTQVNLLLNSQDVIVEVDRSHTLPFPILFAWDPKKIKENIDERFTEKTTDEYLFKKESYFDKNYFEKIKQRNLSHKEIVDMFHQVFEATLSRGYTEKQLLFKSIELVKDFFLKLFSETELLPEFMNKSIDAVSEWKLAADHTYKISLAKGLNDLIRMESPIKESDTVVRLLPYLDETIVHAENYFKAEKLKLPTPASAWNLVCLGLVKEAVMKTVKGVAFKEAIDDINQNIKGVMQNQFFNDFSTTNKVDLVRAMNKANSSAITTKHDEIIQKMLNPIKV